MNTMHTTVLITHTVIAVIITVLVLLQRGKGADAGAGFGAGASGTVFGARGSTNFFSRATAVLATAFFASSLTLAYLSAQQGSAPSSLIESAAPLAPATVPVESAEDLLPEFPDAAGVEATSVDDDMPSLDGGTPEPDVPEGPEDQ